LLLKLLKILLKVILLLVVLYGIGRFYVVYTDSRLTGERQPYIQSLSTESVVIHWMTEEEQPSIVRYGKDRYRLDHQVSLDDEVNDHIVSLSGLKADTRYWYSVGDKQTGSSDEHRWFRTHPVKSRPIRVWVLGDSGEPGATLEQVRDSALGQMRANPHHQAVGEYPVVDVWIALGDIAYRSGTNDQFQAALFDTFGELTSNTSLWPVYGNHDDRRWTYFRIFDLPENAESGGIASGTENYYSFDHANAHFVILDSQESDRSADGEMAEWLRKNLAANDKPWVIVAFHHPPYTKGTHDSDNSSDSRGRMQDMRENILPILEEYGVDMVLSGHSHMYERSHLIDCAYGDSTEFSKKNIVSRGELGGYQYYRKPLKKRSNQGVIYVVAGSSSKVDQGPIDHPAHAVGFLEAGSMVIDISENILTARFVNSQGEVRDDFRITKQAGYDSGYAGCEQASGLVGQ
jgi:predicted phosphodiesterase